MNRKRCIDCARCYKDTLSLPITGGRLVVFYCPIVPWAKNTDELYRYNRCHFYKNKEEIK